MRISPLRLILAPEKGFYALAIIYGVAIGILTLSIPISVQVLISTVANTAQPEPVVILAVALLVLLAFSALFLALQYYALELFERRFFARIASEVVLRFVYARYAHLESLNRDEMANRYFDIMTVQKNMPILLTGGISLFLQTLVGFAVTSFYHPLLLVFNLAVVALAALIWRALHRGAKESAVALSHAKYDMAGWLEELARANFFFKSHRNIQHALSRSEELSQHYVDEHKRHFFYTFGQLIGFLVLYAVASAALLGLGGWLVISGELTLGQLVAAELILSAIFVGLTRLGYYLRSYYEMRAAVKKIAVFFDISLEAVRGDEELACSSSQLVVRGVRSRYRGEDLTLNLTVPSGAHVLVAATGASLAKNFADLLQRFRDPDAGTISIGGVDLTDVDVHHLRDEIAVVDSPIVLERSIAEYLGLADPTLSRARIREVVAQVGLADEVQKMEGGLDRRLTPNGYPLSVSETMRLKLAYALLCRPRIIVLTPLFDVVGHQKRLEVLEAIRRIPEITLIYFSNRRDLDCFDRFLFFSATEQRYVRDLEELQREESAQWTGDAEAARLLETGGR
ncbi:MAG: ABC transporter ATP-binding protein [Myxococcota bacterium]|nr:ABC transporter ATP-binding protein [Myxococcota bacterium]